MTSAPFHFLAAAALSVQATAPAYGAVFFMAPRFEAHVMTALEPPLKDAMPGATETEQRAALVWNLRQGLLLGALQCHMQFPTLLTTPNYNALLTNHAQELAAAYKVISGYFRRTTKGAKAAQTALDSYTTRTTSFYSTVRSQPSFCYMAGSVGREALYVPRGGLTQFAAAHLGQLRDSLKGGRDQQFRLSVVANDVPIAPSPPLDKRCWTQKGAFNVRKCAGSLAG